jgi:hypothetical protein
MSKRFERRDCPINHVVRTFARKFCDETNAASVVLKVRIIQRGGNHGCHGKIGKRMSDWPDEGERGEPRSEEREKSVKRVIRARKRPVTHLREPAQENVLGVGSSLV